MESIIYNQSGKKTGSIKLPEKIFNVPFNADTVHEVITSMQSNARLGTAHSKGRGEVRGGGKKPWQQKGTGRARHGSRRSPIWRGGGITFGPTTEKNYVRKINKKTKVKALYMLLSEKIRNGELLFLDTVNVAEAKTKNAKKILIDLSAISGFKDMQAKKKNAAFIYTAQKNSATERGFKNFGNVSVAPIVAMNLLDIATYKYIIVTDPEKSITFLESKTKQKN